MDSKDPLNFQLPPAAAPPPTGTPQDQGNDKAAADFARAKINSIFSSQANAQAAPPPVAAATAPAQIPPPSEPTEQPAVSAPQPVPPPAPALTPTFETLPLPGANQAAAAQPTRAQQIAQFKDLHSSASHADKRGHLLRPLIKAALVTALVFLVYNAPIVMGQVYYYITPANSQPTPVILDDPAAGAVDAAPKIIISKLNIDAPVVYDETSYDEARIHAALERGIVHYGTTGLPGQLGNTVLLGHSSNSPWAPGKFKTAFSLLRRLEVSDTFVLHYNGTRYIYEVYEKKVIEPNDFSVIDQRVSEPIVTLITCDPPGVNWKRLAIIARQISPDPAKSQPATGPATTPDDIKGSLPSTPPSLFDRMRDWIF